MKRFFILAIVLLLSVPLFAQKSPVERIDDWDAFEQTDFITRKEAVLIAEKFVVDNGYTDKPRTILKSDIVREALEEFKDIDIILKIRKGTLQPKAVSAKLLKTHSWLVVFLRKNKKVGRGVIVESKGAKIRMLHQNIKIENFVDLADKTEAHVVENIIDGNTFKLINGERVRLIGIRTPQIGHTIEAITKMGAEAKDFMGCFVQEGDKVYLEYDVQKRDKDGRLLAYVWQYAFVQAKCDFKQPKWMMMDSKSFADVMFLNASIVKSGYATPMAIAPNGRYAGLFEELYAEAREQGRGFWSDKNQ